MLAYVIVAFFLLIPLTLFTSHSLASGVCVGAVLALAFLILQRFQGLIEQSLAHTPLIISYSVLLNADASSSTLHGDWAGHNEEGALRSLGHSKPCTDA